MNDLAISLDGTSKTPLYEQIYRYIKHEIQTGGIKSGDKLPSTRALCRYLDVSRDKLYIRVRSYKKAGKKTYYGKWSKSYMLSI